MVKNSRSVVGSSPGATKDPPCRKVRCTFKPPLGASMSQVHNKNGFGAASIRWVGTRPSICLSSLALGFSVKDARGRCLHVSGGRSR
ncbi:hypothetical protein TNCV_2579041 [Trichonephila clavipes]|nr:hypothetical protein TNCV_2579041 [Trichonephila clavipes]